MDHPIPPRPLRLSVAPLDLETARPFGISRWSRSLIENIVVRVQGESVMGLGEGAPNARFSECQGDATMQLSDLKLPETGCLDDVELLIESLQERVAGGAARSAVDMALWDYHGKRSGRSLAEMWGLPSQGPRTSYTIGLDRLDVMAAKTREVAQWPILKVKVGTDEDPEVVKTVRRHSGADLWVDANEAWDTPEQALRMIETLAALGVTLVEQPLAAGQDEDMRWLKERSPVPLYADESCVWGRTDMALLAEGFDGVNLKLDKCGGLLRGRSMLQAAREADLQVMVGCNVASSLAITAAAHLAVLADHADLDGHLLLKSDPYEGLTIDSEYRVVLPDGAGLGVQRRV